MCLVLSGGGVTREEYGAVFISVMTSGPITSPWRPAQGAQKECTTHCRCCYSMDVSGSSDDDYMHV